MRIVRFLAADGPRIGLVRSDRVIDLLSMAQARGLDWLRPFLRDLRAFLLAGHNLREMFEDVADDADYASTPISEVRVLAPFEAGAKILAHVVNYFEHGAEANITAPEIPL